MRANESSGLSTATLSSGKYIDAFTDLDPLGTGKSRPYIDKKYFFQELKNPPKKVLKDLSERDGSFSANFTSDRNEKLSDTPIFDQSISNMRKSSDGSNKDTHFSDSEQIGNENVSSAVSASEIFKMDMGVNKTDDPIIGNNKVLLVTDNDPFSPRMKKFDPFEDDFSKTTIDPFDLSFNNTGTKQKFPSDTKIINESATKGDETNSVFNGPLQVSLPPESYSAFMHAKRMERHASDASETNSMVRNRPNVIKQNTVDVISSLGSKKVKPYIFSQKFSKRDSNSINMRRLQESDSMSENEGAPDPPPRPDSALNSDPPPLPPKKQFSDIVIRPRVTSPLATTQEASKYDYLSTSKLNQSICGQSNNDDSPALPLPSRRVGRTDSSYPGPGRPDKKTSKGEDDYLTPITSKMDELPILLPPPQTKGSFKNRGRRIEGGAQPKSDTQVKTSTETEASTTASAALPAAIPDITLSQLLTLGVDDLALKLNVPVNKLNTMTIVELTKNLSDFIEKSSQKTSETPSVTNRSQARPLKAAGESAVFKVSFDNSSDATFIAKFDDNFAEDNDFVPDFEQFNKNSLSATVDRYAVFREIIEQEMKTEENPQDKDFKKNIEDENVSNVDEPIVVPNIPKIDTKITAVISQAKDRYAALRDIILVEDLFEKSITNDQSAQNVVETFDAEAHNFGESEQQSSPDVNISISFEDDRIDDPHTANTVFSRPTLSTRDDLEIDEYMNRAISNLSLDNRDHLSPLSTKSPVTKSLNASTSPIQIQEQKSSTDNLTENAQKGNLNDVSTSPMSIRKSPLEKSPMSKSPVTEALLTPKSPKQTRANVENPSSFPEKSNADENATFEDKNGKSFVLIMVSK